jgi:hypothetical protein
MSTFRLDATWIFLLQDCVAMLCDEDQEDQGGPVGCRPKRPQKSIRLRANAQRRG